MLPAVGPEEVPHSGSSTRKDQTPGRRLWFAVIAVPRSRCWRMCSSQLATVKSSTKHSGSSASRKRPHRRAPARRRARPTADMASTNSTADSAGTRHSRVTSTGPAGLALSWWWSDRVDARGVLRKELIAHLRSRRTMRWSKAASTAGQARGLAIPNRTATVQGQLRRLRRDSSGYLLRRPSRVLLLATASLEGGGLLHYRPGQWPGGSNAWCDVVPSGPVPCALASASCCRQRLRCGGRSADGCRVTGFSDVIDLVSCSTTP
jgi:hypothetical protein